MKLRGVGMVFKVCEGLVVFVWKGVWYDLEGLKLKSMIVETNSYGI